MRIFFDTEFIDAGESVHLVSLGAVREDGAEFYGESSEVDWSLASPWVLENVKSQLVGPQRTLVELRYLFFDFARDATEFWAYYGAYDWFLICRLFGGFFDLPPRWPHYFHDLETLRVLKGHAVRYPKQQGKIHHALNDARWNSAVYAFLSALPWKGDFVNDKTAKEKPDEISTGS